GNKANKLFQCSLHLGRCQYNRNPDPNWDLTDGIVPQNRCSFFDFHVFTSFARHGLCISPALTLAQGGSYGQEFWWKPGAGAGERAGVREVTGVNYPPIAWIKTSPQSSFLSCQRKYFRSFGEHPSIGLLTTTFGWRW